VPAGAAGLVLGAFVMWIGTGVFEEVVFRGCSSGGRDGPGAGPGLIYAASVFAVLHIGHASAPTSCSFGSWGSASVVVAAERLDLAVSVAPG